jgi:hypothetical protein
LLPSLAEAVCSSASGAILKMIIGVVFFAAIPMITSSPASTSPTAIVAVVSPTLVGILVGC